MRVSCTVIEKGVGAQHELDGEAQADAEEQDQKETEQFGPQVPPGSRPELSPEHPLG